MSDKISYKNLSNYNSLVCYITHASKTTSFVLPAIYANSCSNSNHCFFISDKKMNFLLKLITFKKSKDIEFESWTFQIQLTWIFETLLMRFWMIIKDFKKSLKLSEASYIIHMSLNERVNSLLDLFFTSNKNTNEAFWSKGIKEFFAMII